MSSGCVATLAGGGWSPEEMVTKAIRPVIFKWRQTEPELILCAVRWYLRCSLSFRDVEELLSERGLEVDHTTIWRWVQRYGPELEEQLRRHLKTINKSWRVDETYATRPDPLHRAGPVRDGRRCSPCVGVRTAGGFKTSSPSRRSHRSQAETGLAGLPRAAGHSARA